MLVLTSWWGNDISKKPSVTSLKSVGGKPFWPRWASLVFLWLNSRNPGTKWTIHNRMIWKTKNILKTGGFLHMCICIYLEYTYSRMDIHLYKYKYSHSHALPFPLDSKQVILLCGPLHSPRQPRNRIRRVLAENAWKMKASHWVWTHPTSTYFHPKKCPTNFAMS